jgi:hypothetical protein
MRRAENDDDLSVRNEEKKSTLRWLCSSLFCCSCSRRATPTPEERNRRANGQFSCGNCARSPGTVSFVVDLLFLGAMVWVLYDAAKILHTQEVSWYWAVPAAFAAPAIAVFALKVRYVMRMSDIAWYEDKMWNVRVMPLPMLSLLINTIMISVWLLTTPLYVVQIANSMGPKPPLSLEGYTEVVQQATFNLLLNESSLALFVTYLISVVFSVRNTFRHRRVAIRFLHRAMENGMNVEGQRPDTSLLTREEMNAKNTFEPGLESAQAVMVVDANADPASMDSLYTTSFVRESPRYMTAEQVPAGVSAVISERGEITVKPPGAMHFDTVRGQLAQEAVARRKDTMDRFDISRAQTLQPPPPSANPPPPRSNGADDESETHIDSPRTIARIVNQRAGSRRTSKKE